MGLIQNASKSLAKQLASNLTTDQKLRVGILPLDEKSGSTIEIADALQESLKTRLFLTKRFDVIEDDDMKKVLQELKVQEQGEGILKQETIQHVGEQLGADAIVVGKITVTEHDTMFNFYNDYLIDYRLVPIKSGVVGSAGETMISTSRF
jgi:TolB-like protein